MQILVGDKFGRLSVVREVESRRSGRCLQRCVECRCECGLVKEYLFYSLRSGNTRSCGCLSRDIAGDGARKHGFSGSSEYHIWLGMRVRCRKEEDGGDRRYGGRGITVCDRWRNSFEAFYSDMGPRPSPKHSIDRIKNDGNYELLNCRWATSKQQMRNTRVNRLIEHNGETRCLADWAEHYGLRPEILYGRLVTAGWTFEKSVGMPASKRSTARSLNPHYRVPVRERDAAWHREHERLEVIRIERDRQELELSGDRLAKTHCVDADEFKLRVDAALSEGWTWKGSVLRALREMAGT